MEGLTSFLQVGGFVIAMLTIYRALSEYGKNNMFQRAKKLEDLIEKFKDKKMYVAKSLLDDYIELHYEGIDLEKVDVPTPKNLRANVTIVHAKLEMPRWSMVVKRDRKTDKQLKFKKNGQDLERLPFWDEKISKIVHESLPNVDRFTFINLSHLLRTHKGDFIGYDEVYFRNSFDELLDFYCLLIYYLRNEIITIREVRAHFLFHLLTVKKCVPLIHYIRIYYEEEGFEWLFRQLPDVSHNRQIQKADPAILSSRIQDSLQELHSAIDDSKEHIGTD